MASGVFRSRGDRWWFERRTEAEADRRTDGRTLSWIPRPARQPRSYVKIMPASPSLPPFISPLRFSTAFPSPSSRQNAPQTRRPRQHRGGTSILPFLKSRAHSAYRCRSMLYHLLFTLTMGYNYEYMQITHEYLSPRFNNSHLFPFRRVPSSSATTVTTTTTTC